MLCPSRVSKARKFPKTRKREIFARSPSLLSQRIARELTQRLMLWCFRSLSARKPRLLRSTPTQQLEKEDGISGASVQEACAVWTYGASERVLLWTTQEDRCWKRKRSFAASTWTSRRLQQRPRRLTFWRRFNPTVSRTLFGRNLWGKHVVLDRRYQHQYKQCELRWIKGNSCSMCNGTLQSSKAVISVKFFKNIQISGKFSATR